MAAATMARPPHPFWTLTEGRAIFEFGAFGLFRKQMKNLPKDSNKENRQSPDLGQIHLLLTWNPCFHVARTSGFMVSKSWSWQVAVLAPNTPPPEVWPWEGP